MDTLIWLLLPVAATCGWIAALWANRTNKQQDVNRGLSADYFKGIDYLLNDQQDKALDIFIQVLEVDVATTETHLALGNLYRRRGEVDRAIRIHQNVMARSELDSSQRSEALLELGQDYLSAGLLDRAEDLFRELVDGGYFVVQALRQLIDIYEQERDWHKAIAAACDLERETGSALGMVIAQYWCELADRARFDKDWDTANNYAVTAKQSFPACVRASIIQGDVLLSQGDARAAFDVYKSVQQQDVEFVSEVIEPMRRAAHACNDLEGLVDYLRCLLSEHGGISATLALAELTEENVGKTAAANFMTEQLRARPSVRGFDRLLELEIDSSKGEQHAYAQTLKSLTAQLMANRPIYKCGHCGFPARAMHWQCPGCKHWNTVTPIQGVEGE